jgi:hypothetical protein
MQLAVPVRYRRAEKGRLLQKLQHAIPSVIVLGDGLDHLRHDPHGSSLALGFAEVLVAVLVIGSVARGVRKLFARGAGDPHADAPHHIDWIDIFLGAMLLVEAYAKFHATAHLPRPTITLGVVLIIVGLLHGRIAKWGERRLQLRVDDTGISVPGRFFRRLTLTWPDVAECGSGPATARVIARDGRDQAIDLADAVNPDAILGALAEAQARLTAFRAAPASPANGALT